MDLSSPIDEKTDAGVVPVSTPAARWNSAVVSAAALPCWCGGGRWSLCFCTAKFELLRCSACGSYQTDPPPLRTDEESAQFYTDYYSNSQRPNQVVQADAKRDARFRRVAEKAPGWAEIRHSVMDIGSGDGHFCAELRTAASLHMPAYRLSQYLSRWASGDLKGRAWRAHQEIGGLYGRMINSGPMLYVVSGRT